MPTLVHLRGVIHVYDSSRRCFVKKNAKNVARALGESGGRSLHRMLAQVEWVRSDERREHYVALRHREEARPASYSQSPAG